MKAPKLTQQELVEVTVSSAKKHGLSSKELEDRLVEAGCSSEEVSKLVREYESEKEPRSE